MRELRLTDEMRCILELVVPGATGLTQTDANALPFQYRNAFTILLYHGMIYWSSVLGCYRATATGTVALERQSSVAPAVYTGPTPPAFDDADATDEQSEE